MELDLSIFDNKKILITGGGGYLGSKLAEVLTISKVKIYLLDIKFNALAEKLNTEFDHLIKVYCDIANKYEIEEAVTYLKPDLIFHFAALLNRKRDFSDYEQLYKVNVEGTLNLLEVLRRVHYAGFYYASSSEVYGNKNPSPFREDQIPSPASPYSLTKLMAELLISTHSQINSKPFTILRLFNFYGPNMPPSFFLSQLENSLNNNIPFEMTIGDQKRDFSHIDDMIALILNVVKNPESNLQIINICSGKATSIKDLAIQTATQYAKLNLLRIGALPYRENEIWEMVGDNNKMQQLINH